MDNEVTPSEIKKSAKARQDVITTTEKGSVSINEAVIVSIAKNAASHVPGIVRLTSTGKFAESIAFMIGRTQSKPDSVQIKTTGDKVGVSVKIIVSYGKNIPEVALNVQLAIIQAIKDMAQMEVSKVDVTVEGVEEEETEEAIEIVEPIL
ncbi:MAG: Asp23/Gls24 family envelope stress response protein [Lentisphaerota bacterium]